MAPEAFTHCFLAWTNALRDLSEGAIVSMDGKTLRHAFARAASQAAMHRVRAWARANRLVWGQGKGDDTSNAITAIPTLLTLRDWTGATVTLDAMGCQKDIAKVLTAQGADSGRALTDNHPTLCEDVALFFADGHAPECAERAHDADETVEGDHGRIVTRRSWITAASAWGGAPSSWANVPSVGMGKSRRDVGEEVERETRYVRTSLPAEGGRFAHAVRQHWGMEHSRHWVLEVSCDEEACRIRTDKGAQTCAVLRHLALHLLRRATSHTRGMKARRKRAG